MRHFTFLLLFAFCTSVNYSQAQCTSKHPKKLTLSGETGCQATLSWKAVNNNLFYTVKYKGTSGPWIEIPTQITATSYTFTGLQPNLLYTFAVSSHCSESSASTYSKIEQSGIPCGPPTNITATAIASSTFTFSWTNSCVASTVNQLRYKKITATKWKYVSTGSATSTTLSFQGTNPVMYQVTACSDTTGNWSALDTVYLINSTTPSKPNAIVILLDDSRYDTYSCNGAPSFFQTPNIDRIANEGVNFKNSFVIFSLCNPSRASILTGLYANHNGAQSNKDMFYDYLPTISTVMDQQGYYTAFMGKYLNANDQDPVPAPGWDWWMARVGSGHQDADFNYNGTTKNMVGHVTDVLTDSTVALINRVNEPFLIYICYSATHSPYKPRTEDKHLYENEVMPIPDNFAPYEVNYPNFLTEGNLVSPDSAGLSEDYLGYFQVMAGVEEDLTKIYDALENKHILDSTLIIFTSDNGFLMGEHYLQGKRVPQEESMRVPMFMRYPKWFPAGSVNTNQMVLNIDIAPTLFDLAGVPDTIPLDGLSMHKLFTGEKNRNTFYYQATLLNDAAVNCRSVRSLHYKYTYYYCDEITEEFFDLANDPKENTNLINDAAHQPLIQIYRQKLDSFKTALNDTITEEISVCNIENPVLTRFTDDEEEQAGIAFQVFPNPSSGTFQLEIPLRNNHGSVNVAVYNLYGSEVFKQESIGVEAGKWVTVNISNLPDGIYNVQVAIGQDLFSKKITIVR
ncbi:MAG: sulfatase-like hydrolase/transferase [Chitinophagaceae bacterium]|nr:sulfatase-like hydrolase/transferase [Chitinophagaceae bacterium]